MDSGSSVGAMSGTDTGGKGSDAGSISGLGVGSHSGSDAVAVSGSSIVQALPRQLCRLRHIPT
jgi:hypothetical protein